MLRPSARLAGRLRSRLRRIDPASATPVWYLPDPGIVYVHIPKVATRSTRAALAAYAYGETSVSDDGSNRAPSIERAAERFERKADLAEIKRLTRHAYSFAFVRDPLDRLHSAFSDKIVGLGRDLFGDGSSPSTFAEFVERAAATSDANCDSHLRSQHCYVADRDGPVVSFVGRFERLADDWLQIASRFGLPPLPHRNKTEHAPYLDAYTPEIARIAADRYARDIEFFGYAEAVGRLSR